MFLNYLLAAVKARGGFVSWEHGAEEPPRVSESNLCLSWATTSASLGLHHSEGDLELRNPQKCLSRRYFGFCASVDILHCVCTGSVMTDSSLNPPGCRGFGRTVCGHRRLWRVLAGWDVTPVSPCLCTPSSAEGHVCDIISLLNKTSEIFNLAVCSHVSWVQTALFYMITSINIVIPSTKGCHAFFLCANGPSFLETPISTYRYLQKKELSELGA